LVILLIVINALTTIFILLIISHLNKNKLIFYNKAVEINPSEVILNKNNQSRCRLAVSFERGGAKPSLSYMEELSKAAKFIGACSNYQSIYWDQVEVEKGKFDWSTTDKYINIQTDNGIKPLGRLWMTPSFYSSAPQEKMTTSDYTTYSKFYAPKLENLNEWSRFVSQAVKRYGDKIDSWLLYHEPQEGLYFQTPGNRKHPILGNEDSDGMTYKNFEDAVYYYYLTQRYGSAVIKDISPTAKLYLTSFNPKYTKYLDLFYNLVRRPGFRNSFDIVREVTYTYKTFGDFDLQKKGLAFLYEIDSHPEVRSLAMSNKLSSEVNENIQTAQQILQSLGINKKMFAETGVNSDFNNNFILDPYEEQFQADSLSDIISAYLNSPNIERLYIFRLANSDPNEEGMTEGQKKWRTLGLYKISRDEFGYHLARPKTSALQFKSLAKKYNRADNLKKEIPTGRYYYPNAPCEDLKTDECAFDARLVLNDKAVNKLYELIALKNNFYIAPLTEEIENKSRAWKKINLKSYFKEFDPNSFFCDQSKTNLPCLVDTMTARYLPQKDTPNPKIIISFTFGNKKYGVINDQLEVSNYLFQDNGNHNLVFLDKDNEKYAKKDGPCYETSEKDCFFNTRSFRNKDNKLVESITKGEYLYEFDEILQTWTNSRLDNNEKYFKDNNSPCHNMKLCVFDSYTYFEENGRMFEEITIDNILYRFDIDSGNWLKIQLSQLSY